MNLSAGVIRVFVEERITQAVADMFTLIKRLGLAGSVRHTGHYLCSSFRFILCFVEINLSTGSATTMIHSLKLFNREIIL